MPDEFDRPLPTGGGRKPRKISKTGAKPYTQLPLEFMASDAWKGMTLNSRMVLERILIEFNKTKLPRRRNGDIALTYADFMAHGIGRRGSIGPAIDRCEQLGFIIVKRGHRATAGTDGETNRYGLTFLPRDGEPIARHEWELNRHAAKGRELAARMEEARQRPNLAALNEAKRKVVALRPRRRQ